MKTYQLTLAILLLIFFLSNNSKAQTTIDSLKIIPTNPTTTDTIKVIIYTGYDATPCGLDSVVFDTIGNQILVSATAQLGDGASPCFSIDTFTIGLLNAATYELIVDLSTDTPQTTYDTDTIYFTVQLVNGLQLCDNSDQRIKIYPNPTNNWLTISVKKSILGKIKIEVFDLAGKLVLADNQPLQSEFLQVNVSSIINGNYLFKLTFTDGTTDVFKVSINR